MTCHLEAVNTATNSVDVTALPFALVMLDNSRAERENRWHREDNSVRERMCVAWNGRRKKGRKQMQEKESWIQTFNAKKDLRRSGEANKSGEGAGKSAETQKSSEEKKK